jgi:hypothetical protein
MQILRDDERCDSVDDDAIIRSTCAVNIYLQQNLGSNGIIRYQGWSNGMWEQLVIGNRV